MPENRPNISSEMPRSMYLKGVLNSDKFDSAIAVDREKAAKLRAEIETWQVEVSEAVHSEVQKIQAFFQARIDKYNPTLILPPLYFVAPKSVYPEDSVNEFGSSIAGGEIIFGKSIDTVGSIVVRQPYMDDAELVILAFHELDHAASITLKQVQYGRVFDFLSGAIQGGTPRRLGYFFEEGLVLVETEEFLHDRIKDEFPNLYEKKKMISNDAFGSDFASTAYWLETSPNRETPPMTISGEEPARLAKTIQILFDRIPELKDELIKARLTGKFGKIHHLIDVKFGKGMFRRLYDIENKKDLSVTIEKFNTILRNVPETTTL